MGSVHPCEILDLNFEKKCNICILVKVEYDYNYLNGICGIINLSFD